MMFRKLCNREGTPTVSLDNDDLRLDGIFADNGDVPANQEMHVQRVGEGAYLVRAVDDGSVPDVSVSVDDDEELAL
ncbi:hypothetical protein G9464_05060 [Halostella sp. JP-L12]|nr:hypothetical protein [Halostella sp. JP-L12]